MISGSLSWLRMARAHTLFERMIAGSGLSIVPELQAGASLFPPSSAAVAWLEPALCQRWNPAGGRAFSTSCALGSASKLPDSTSALLADDSGSEGEEGAVLHAGEACTAAGGDRTHAQQVLEGLYDTSAVSKVLDQHAGQEALQDPLSRMMASQGMPLGIAVDAIRQGSRRGHGVGAPMPWSNPSSTECGPTQAAGYSMEALDDMLSSAQARAGGAAVTVPAMAASAQPDSTESGPLRHSGGPAGGAGGGAAGRGGDDEPGDDSDADAGAAALGEGPGAQDHWGTTRQDPAQIARRLAETNAGPEGGEAGADGEEDPVDEPLDPDHAAPGEAKYRTLEQMSADIKGLDEVFEVLAQVPWLDEGDVKQKELKGVAMVGLLGTLEEVGFDIRDQVQRIWAGDHDDGMILECAAAKDQAALISILFHTKQLLEQFGQPGAYLPAPAGSPAVGPRSAGLSESIIQRLAGASKDEGERSGEGR